MQSWYTIELNGRPWHLEGVSVRVSLLEALKSRGEIDPLCSADSDQNGVLVMMLDGDRERCPVFRTIDCGRVPLVMMAGRKIWTLDGLQQAFADHPLWAIEKRYPVVETHPLRRANLLFMLFEWCGLCREQREVQQPEGFISRTADYVGVKKMFKDLMEIDVYGADRVDGEKVEEWEELQYVDGTKNRFYRPQTIVELLALKRQASNSQVIAGATGRQGLGEESKSPVGVFLSAEGIGELRSLVDEGSHWEIGSAVPLSEIAGVLGGEYPELGEVLKRFESGPIRNRATLGGQLNTAAGRAELGPVLLALDIRVRLLSEGGARDLTLDSFYGRNEEEVLRSNEIIKSVSLPRNTAEMLRVKDCKFRLCEAYKIASRRSACRGMITAAFALEINSAGELVRAILVYGSLLSRPVLAVKSAAALKGKIWNQETVIGVLKELDKEVAELGKLGAKDDKRLWVTTLFQKFHHQHPGLKMIRTKQLEKSGEGGAKQIGEN